MYISVKKEQAFFVKTKYKGKIEFWNLESSHLWNPESMDVESGIHRHGIRNPQPKTPLDFLTIWADAEGTFNMLSKGKSAMHHNHEVRHCLHKFFHQGIDMRTKKQTNLASTPEWVNFDILKFRIHKHYPLDKSLSGGLIVVYFVNITYPQDSDLYNG